MYPDTHVPCFIQVCIYSLQPVHMILTCCRSESKDIHDMCTDLKYPQGNISLQGANEGFIYLDILIIPQQ